MPLHPHRRHHCYIENLYRSSDQHAAVRDSAPIPQATMQISHHEARIIATIIALAAPRLVLEIGSFVGYSTLHIASAMVDAAGGYNPAALPPALHLVTIEKNRDHFLILEDNLRRYREQHATNAASTTLAATPPSPIRLTALHADATLALPPLRDTHFAGELLDAIFIDGPKADYPTYLAYANANLRRGGLLIADNTLLFGTLSQYQSGEEIADRKLRRMWESISGFNQQIAESGLYHSAIIPTNEGLTIAVRR